MKLDGETPLALRQVLNVFCEYHNISVMDEVAVEAAAVLVKLVAGGELNMQMLRDRLEDWFAPII